MKKWQLVAKWDEKEGYLEVEPARNTKEEAKKDLKILNRSIGLGGCLPYLGVYINEFED